MQTIQKAPLRALAISKRYGITENKKAELDALTLQVLDAQHDVEQYQSIVTSLTEKVANFQGFLAIAETTRSHTNSNRVLIEQMVQSALDLQNNSKIGFNEIVLADSKTKALAENIKIVIDKLIYSAEVIAKLSNIIIQRKALNPLISDELISMVGAAGKDANNAVALTLVALKSVFAAQASNMESEAAMSLEYTQTMALYKTITGSGGTDKKVQSLESLLRKAYTDAKANYARIEKALTITVNQLNDAKAGLNKAQVKLKSLQAGLAAADAAALAS
jgi:hypothetical protein